MSKAILVLDLPETCYGCDYCWQFDEKAQQTIEIETCERYIIDEYHARKRRKKFKIVR